MASSVNLGETLEDFVDRLVTDGRYGSRSEVLREGVRLVQEREARLAAFDREIERGLRDLDEGRSAPADAVLDRLRRKYEALAARSAA